MTGLHQSAGGGGHCLEHMSLVRDNAELEAKLPFFCLPEVKYLAEIATQVKDAVPIIQPALYGAEVVSCCVGVVFGHSVNPTDIGCLVVYY